MYAIRKCKYSQWYRAVSKSAMQTQWLAYGMNCCELLGGAPYSSNPKVKTNLHPAPYLLGTGYGIIISSFAAVLQLRFCASIIWNAYSEVSAHALTSFFNQCKQWSTLDPL